MKKNDKVIASIDRAKAKLESLRGKYRTWDPVDRSQLRAWQGRLDAMRNQAEFAENPVIKNWIRYCVQARENINLLLKTDKELLTDPKRAIDRVTLMDKRDFYEAAIAIFVPNPDVVARIESDIGANLATPMRPIQQEERYPHSSLSDFGGRI